MAAFDSIRYRWVGSCLGLGTELVVRATRSICDGSLLNADSGRADTRARLDEWAGVLSLYDPLTDTQYDVPVARPSQRLNTLFEASVIAAGRSGPTEFN